MHCAGLCVRACVGCGLLGHLVPGYLPSQKLDWGSDTKRMCGAGCCWRCRGGERRHTKGPPGGIRLGPDLDPPTSPLPAEVGPPVWQMAGERVTSAFPRSAGRLLAQLCGPLQSSLIWNGFWKRAKSSVLLRLMEREALVTDNIGAGAADSNRELVTKSRDSLRRGPTCQETCLNSAGGTASVV